jgi:hypothetical protein
VITLYSGLIPLYLLLIKRFLEIAAFVDQQSELVRKIASVVSAYYTSTDNERSDKIVEGGFQQHFSELLLKGCE